MHDTSDFASEFLPKNTPCYINHYLQPSAQRILTDILSEFLKNSWRIFRPEKKTNEKLNRNRYFWKKTSSLVHCPWVNIKTTQISKKKKIEQMTRYFFSFTSCLCFFRNKIRNGVKTCMKWNFDFHFDFDFDFDLLLFFYL